MAAVAVQITAEKKTEAPPTLLPPRLSRQVARTVPSSPGSVGGRARLLSGP